MSPDNPEITIIIPAKDAGAYISKCIDSVVKQDYADWELLVINDHSSDDTAAVAKTFADSESRIMVYDLPGCGVSAARNYGIELAKGRYIGFVDADDTLEPGYLSELLGNVKRNDAAVSQCSFWLLYGNGDKVKDKEAALAVYSNHSDIMNAYFSGIIGTINVGSWGKLFDRELISDIRFDETLLIEEDALFTFQCCMKADKVVCTDKPLYNYFQHSESVRNRKFNISNMQYFTVFDRELDICKEDKKICRRIRIRKLVTALDLISKIIRDRSGNELLGELREIALKTSEIITKDGRLGFKLGLKVFLVRYFPSAFYGLLKIKSRFGRVV